MGGRVHCRTAGSGLRVDWGHTPTASMPCGGQISGVHAPLHRTCAQGRAELTMFWFPSNAFLGMEDSAAIVLLTGTTLPPPPPYWCTTPSLGHECVAWRAI